MSCPKFYPERGSDRRPTEIFLGLITSLYCRVIGTARAVKEQAEEVLFWVKADEVFDVARATGDESILSFETLKLNFTGQIYESIRAQFSWAVDSWRELGYEEKHGQPWVQIWNQPSNYNNPPPQPAYNQARIVLKKYEPRLSDPAVGTRARYNEQWDSYQREPKADPFELDFRTQAYVPEREDEEAIRRSEEELLRTANMNQTHPLNWDFATEVRKRERQLSEAPTNKTPFIAQPQYGEITPPFGWASPSGEEEEEDESLTPFRMPIGRVFEKKDPHFWDKALQGRDDIWDNPRSPEYRSWDHEYYNPPSPRTVPSPLAPPKTPTVYFPPPVSPPYSAPTSPPRLTLGSLMEQQRQAAVLNSKKTFQPARASRPSSSASSRTPSLSASWLSATPSPRTRASSIMSPSTYLSPSTVLPKSGCSSRSPTPFFH
ncbi:hypothetical protein QBC46DRAFT_406164 [Diplogelasinospora grovesii]|uniref:Uncharacterized protein n=1 Tax=Diplogelasinospora grovesii TaxID=303347 RepID=A0AAN6S6V4_9PEZI|nr:hypothetical protein QBC46DRAFT_406164 [Diplogelasinospora grovesii]